MQFFSIAVTFGAACDWLLVTCLRRSPQFDGTKNFQKSPLRAKARKVPEKSGIGLAWYSFSNSVHCNLLGLSPWVVSIVGLCLAQACHLVHLKHHWWPPMLEVSLLRMPSCQLPVWEKECLLEVQFLHFRLRVWDQRHLACLRCRAVFRVALHEGPELKNCWWNRTVCC